MQLEISQGGQTITTLLLKPGNYSLGRGQDNDICLNDSGVSRHHARLEVANDLQVTVIDLNSTNGTWLGNIKVVSSCWEQIDAVLKIGGCQIFLREGGDGIPPPAVALPYEPQKLSPPDPVSSTANRPSDTVHPETSSARKWQNIKKNILLGGIILLLIPFFVFLGKNLFSKNTILQDIENSEKEKMRVVFENKKTSAIETEVAKAQELIAGKNFQPANDIIQNVLQKDPANVQANALKEKIIENIKEHERIAKEQEQEQLRIQKEKERQQKSQMLEQLEVLVEKQIATKDFSACMETAKKILALDPGNSAGVVANNFCSQPAEEAEQTKDRDVAEHEQKKHLSQLKEILKSGNNAVKHKKYEAALKIWARAANIDGDNDFEITKEINKKAANLRKEIAKRIEDNINLGHAAKAKKDYLGALQYYSDARNLSQEDKEAEQWYEKQLKENSVMAEELYNEAIAYASLGSMENAKSSINQAKLLAKGNSKLLENINRKIADYNERK
jgi:hypothetical protein